MKTHFSFIAVVILVIASFGILLGEDINDQVVAKPADRAAEDYHNATINFNVDLPGGEPAAGFLVEVMNSLSSASKDSGTTNSAGFLELHINFMTMGLCELRVYDLSSFSVYFEKIEVWPEEIIDKDITVNEPLDPYNRIHGIVRNASDNSPLPIITVVIRGEDINGNSVTEMNLTDSSGRYSLNVPNSTGPYQISFQAVTGYYPNSYSFFLEEGVNDYDRDFYLKPHYQPSQPIHIRIRDTVTGDYQTRGTLNVEGRSEAFDDTSIYYYIYNGDTDSGWFNNSVDRGSYLAYFQPHYLTKDPYVYVRDHFYVNDTELFHEIPVTLPEYIELEVEVWNSTSFLESAYVTWKEEIDNIVIGCYDNVHTNGIAYLKVPTDRVVDIQITLSGYKTKNIEVDPFGHSSLIEMNVTLEQIPTNQVERANVTIQVVDDITGIGIPFANTKIIKIADNARYTYSYRTNSTGFLKKVVEITDVDYTFTRFEFETDNYLGTGAVTGVKILEGEEKEILIRTKRFELEEPYIRTHFFVKDKTGTPVPGLKLHASLEGDIEGVWVDVVTDTNGRAELIGPPGEYSFSIYSSIKFLRAHWSIKNTRFNVNDPGLIGDITAYSSYPLDTHWGFVKDGDTSEIITNARVESHSVERLEMTRSGGLSEGVLTNEVSLYHMSSGTDRSGFYRTKGTETIKITYSKDGYFNKKVEVQPGTRATQLEDVFLEPLTVPDLWVNGTLVNEMEEPIAGYVYVYDQDHDDHELYEQQVNSTGIFSFPMFSGNFWFYITNNTLSNNVYLTVGTDSIEDLELMLIPTSEIGGMIQDWRGEPLEGINVTLIDPDINEPGEWMLTDEFGEFYFEVVAGNYHVAIERTELFDAFIGVTFETDGWVDKFFDITLFNRSAADVEGRVLGEAGPLIEGVPDALVLLNIDGVEVYSTVADMEGFYVFNDVDHGENYSVEAIPPLEWQPVIGTKSGYLVNSTMNITISGALMELDIMLPYSEYEPPGWLEFVDHFPVGMNVSLDEDIVVKFSNPINISTFIAAFSIEPSIDVNFTLNPDGDTIIMRHTLFEPNTTYTIDIQGSVISDLEYPLRNYSGTSWNFTTSDSISTWKIISVNVTVFPDRTVTFEVLGVRDMTLFVVITGMGSERSYQLNEHLPAHYKTYIPLEDLDWSSTYDYHFSDSEGGPDMSPAHSHFFITSGEPGPGWNLSSSNVIAENDGSLSIEAMGNLGLSVWIKIDGIGWYELVVFPNGLYKLSIGANDLEGDTTYDYYYSDREGGPDMAPGLAGSVTTVENPDADDDDITIIDDDDSDTSTFGKVMVYSLSCCGILLLIVFVILIMMVIAKKRSRADGFDEE